MAAMSRWPVEFQAWAGGAIENKMANDAAGRPSWRMTDFRAWHRAGREPAPLSLHARHDADVVDADAAGFVEDSGDVFEIKRGGGGDVEDSIGSAGEDLLEAIGEIGEEALTGSVLMSSVQSLWTLTTISRGGGGG